MSISHSASAIAFAGVILGSFSLGWAANDPPPTQPYRSAPQSTRPQDEFYDRSFNKLRDRMEDMDRQMRDMGMRPNRFGHYYFAYPFHFQRYLYDPGNRRFYRTPSYFPDRESDYYYHSKFRGQTRYGDYGPYYRERYRDRYDRWDRYGDQWPDD